MDIESDRLSIAVGPPDGETPAPQRIVQLLATMTRLEAGGAIQMDHSRRERKDLLVKNKRPTAPIDALPAARKGK